MLVREPEVTTRTQGIGMGVYNAGREAPGGARTCGSGCGAALARDNTGRLCSKCLRERRDQLDKPPRLSDDFFETPDFIAAFESQHIGKVLKVYRNHPRHREIYGKALTQETLARWLKIKQPDVSKIEKGPAEKNTDKVLEFAEILHLPKHLLWVDFPGESRLSARLSSAKNMLPPPAVVVAPTPALALPVTIDLSTGLPVEPDPETRLRSLISARVHFETMYRNSGGLVTGRRIELYLARQTLPTVSSARSTEDVERRSQRAIGGLIALAGVCAYDSEDWTTANNHFHRALLIAGKTRDRSFHAYVIALMVNQALALQDFANADALSDLGLRFATSTSALSLTVDLRAMKAKALASMGDNSGALSTIKDLEGSIGSISTHGGIAEASYVQEVQLRAKLAEALTSLGDLSAAQQYAEQSFSRDDHARGKVNRLASMATLEVAQGEIERASLVVCRMVESAQGIESRRLASRFAELRAALAGRPAAASADAIDRLDMALMMMS